MDTWLKSFILSSYGDFIFRNFSLTHDSHNLLVGSLFQIYSIIELFSERDFSESLYGYFLYELCNNLFFEDEEMYRRLNLYYVASCVFIENNQDIPVELSYILGLISYSVKHC